MKKVISMLISVILAFTLVSTTTVVFADEVVTGDFTGKTVILHTNDVHGSVLGYAKVAELEKEYKAHGADVIVADAGDYMQGSSYVAESQGEAAIDLMNLAGYDVATIGNHEFDYGVPQLQTCIAKANFDIICANVAYKGEPLVEKGNEIITTSSGLKVGFYALDTTDVKTFANPTLVTDIEVTGEKALYTLAQSQIDELKQDGADIVISLTHLGVDAGAKPWRSIDVYNNTTGTDFGIDGHSHTVMTKGENGEPIQSTGANMQNIGVVVIDNENKKVETNYLTETSKVDADQTVLASAQAVVDGVESKYGEVFATSSVVLDGSRFPGNRNMETNLGDLVTDAMKWEVTKVPNAQNVPDENIIALENGGGIRTSVSAGDITKADIKNVLPFGNTIVMIYLKGSDLLEALENSTQVIPEEMGGFPQVSGIELTVDTTKAYDSTGEYLPDSTWWYGCNSIQRVSIQSINGKAFDPNATYGIATNDYLAAGGDSYVKFANSTGKVDTGISCDNAVMDYVTNKLNGSITSQYAAPQGRVHILEESGKTVTASTCQTKGYTTYKCSHCDYTVKKEVTDFANHNYKTTVTAPTCHSKGYTTYTCKDCGYSYISDFTDMSAHSYTYTYSPAPTCAKAGKKVMTCSVCGYQTIITAPALGDDAHKPVLAQKAVAATYFTNGKTAVYKCSVCGKTLSGGKATAKKAVTISKVTAGKKQFTVTYQKASGATGYDVCFSRNKNFSTQKTISVKGTSCKITGLTTGTTYYVKVRAYKVQSGKKIYSSWSKVSSIKAK